MTSCKDSGDEKGEEIQKGMWIWTWQDTVDQTWSDMGFTPEGRETAYTFTFNVKSAGNPGDAVAGADYKVKAGSAYEYKFEAWTKSGTRTLEIWYQDEYDGGFKKNITITTEHKTYTFTGEPILATSINRGGKNPGQSTMRFYVGDQVGEFTISHLEIKKL